MLTNNLILAAENAFENIPDRSATTKESLAIMGEGWGAIFIVILVMMLFILLLNGVFRDKSKKK